MAPGAADTVSARWSDHHRLPRCRGRMSGLVCFSPLVDLAAGALVVTVGVDALRHIGRPGERLLASLPIVFGFHQLVEAAIWWGLDGRLAPTVWRVGLVAYLVITFGVVPVLVPAAIAALEPARRRWPAIALTLVGLVVAIVLMRAMASSPIGAVAQGHRIVYQVHVGHRSLVVLLYLAATCGALLLASQQPIRRFGLVNLAAAGALIWLDRTALISLWCAWAAITSLTIARHLRRKVAARRAGADHGATPITLQV